MEIALPWVFFAAGALFALAIIVAFLSVRIRRKSSANDDRVPVANSDRLTDLPGFRKRLRDHQLALIAVVLAVITLGASLSLISARPVSSTLFSPDKYNRDIVLCLDVSGSMLEYDAAILQQFGQLAEEFQGERISLVLWNSSAAQIFPLTDDYDFVKENIENVRSSIDGSAQGNYGGYDYWAGTDLGDGYSLIGDGLASCIVRFDLSQPDRSRSIIFATDNYLFGNTIIQLPEAALLARELGITVYGINAAHWQGSPETEEFEQAMLDGNGRYYAANNPNLISDIVQRITAEQATAYKQPAQWIRHDTPEVWILVALGVFALYLLVTWRVRI